MVVAMKNESTRKSQAVKLDKSTKRGRTARAAPRTLREDVRAFKREVVLSTAIEVFYRDGYQNATVDDIAAAMSVTKAVVYYYFDTKEAMLEAVIDRSAALSRESIDRGLEGGATPAQKLALACFHFAAHVLEHQKIIGVYFREDRCFSRSLRARTTISEKNLVAKLAQVIAAGVKSNAFRECDKRLMAKDIMGTISMAYYWYRDGGRLSRQALCRHFAAQSLRLVGYEGEMALDEPPFELK
jgi:AcrR family transcriptional regulator